ncbi:MAG: transporter associated domain-containing protein, partial [Mycobacteriaceae bacterium]
APDGEYETIGGFVLSRLGRIPVVGDEIELDGWRIAVRRMDGRRVDIVSLRRPVEGSPAGDGEEVSGV